VAGFMLRVQPAVTYVLSKAIAFIFSHVAGKCENRKFHVPARCAGWLQGMFLCCAFGQKERTRITRGKSQLAGPIENRAHAYAVNRPSLSGVG